MKKVGLLCGREYAFPPAFLARVNEIGKKDGVAAEFVKLGGTKLRFTAFVCAHSNAGRILWIVKTLTQLSHGEPF